MEKLSAIPEIRRRSSFKCNAAEAVEETINSLPIVCKLIPVVF